MAAVQLIRTKTLLAAYLFYATYLKYVEECSIWTYIQSFPEVSCIQIEHGGCALAKPYIGYHEEINFLCKSSLSKTDCFKTGCVCIHLDVKSSDAYTRPDVPVGSLKKLSLKLSQKTLITSWFTLYFIWTTFCWDLLKKTKSRTSKFNQNLITNNLIILETFSCENQSLIESYS